MQVKDFVATFLNDQNLGGMAVNLIGHVGKMLELAQTRYPEYYNLFRDKRLWTASALGTACLRYPVARSDAGLYVTAGTKSGDDHLVCLFKEKLLQLQAELRALPPQRPQPFFQGVTALFAPKTIYVDAHDRLQLSLENKFQQAELVALEHFDFFNLGVFSYRDVAYYELQARGEGDFVAPKFAGHDKTLILGQLLAFMTIAGITQADYATLSANFSLVN